MSLKFTGGKNLQTANTSLLNGATTLSISLWCRIHSSSELKGVYTPIFTTYWGTKFAFHVIRSGTKWTVRMMLDGAPGASTVDVPVLLDRDYHLAIVAGGGTCSLYANGTLLGGGPLTAPGVATQTSSLILGPQASDLDITLDDVTIWNGYKLSTAEVRRLRDRQAAPTDFSPSQIGWRLTFDGTAGNTAKSSDAGVRDQSATGLQPSSVPSGLTYDVDPSYSSLVRLRSAQLGPSGKTLVLFFEDTHGTTAIPTGIDAHPTLSIDGVATDVSTPGPIWKAGNLPYIAYPLTSPVPPNAAVTMSAPTDWVLAGSLGAVGPIDGLPLANPGPPLLPAWPQTTKTMELGYNTNGVYYWSPVMMYANLVKHSAPGVYTTLGNPVVTYDPVTKAPSNVSGGTSIIRPFMGTATGDDARGYANVPSGTYTLMWDGTGDCTLGEETNWHKLTAGPSTLTGSTDRKRVYTLELSSSPSSTRYAQFRLSMTGSISNIRLYGPGTPTDGSAKFHADYLRMISGAAVVRFMDALITNNSSLVNYVDVHDPRRYAYDSPSRYIYSTVVSVGPHDNSDGYFFQGLQAFVKVTTSAPHGLTSGQLVSLSGLSGGPNGNGRLSMTSGSPIDLGAYTINEGIVCRVLTPTTFAMALYLGYEAQPSSTQPITGKATCMVRPGTPYSELVDLCARIQSDPWICIPHAMTDAAIASLAAELVAILPAGRRLYVEYSNEYWNYGPGFQQAFYIHGQAMLAGLNDSQWYAYRAGQVHALFASAFQAAGRPISDLVRVMGSHAVAASRTSQVADYCYANGIPIDAVCIAPYYHNGPSGFSTIWESLDVDQLHDLSDLSVQYGSDDGSGVKWNATVRIHRAVLAAKFPGARVICYEGGMELGVPPQAYVNRNAMGAKSRAWSRHPRIRGTVRQFLQQLQDDGCAAMTYFTLAGIMGGAGGMTASAVWSAHIRTDQPDGTGDGTDGLFDNRTDYQDSSRVVSVIGTAVQDWFALNPPRTVAVPVDPPPTTSLRRELRLTPGQMRGPRSRPRSR